MKNGININIEEFIETKKVDFLDFGCSNGGSLLFATKILGGEKGLGIDIDSKKVDQTIKQNLLAVLYDIKELPDKKLVDFTIMSHFLEHVPNINDVSEFIEKACSVSKKFIFIKQPFFDHDGLLFENGLKTFYSDWTGHPNTMSSLQFFTILRNLQSKGIIKEFIIAAKGKISDSLDPKIHPLSSPIDQHDYDEKKHPKKDNNITFEFDLFYETIVMISIDNVYEIPSTFKVDKILYRSNKV